MRPVIMKAITFFLTGCILIASCRPSTNEQEQRLRTDNFELRRENDSLKSVLEKAERSYEGDTVQSTLQPKLPATGPGKESNFAGKHLLTLQWISWDRPGSVTIKPIDDTWYSISGQQKEKGNYLVIDGRIRMISDRELEFDGKIEYSVESIIEGEPCIRNGKQIFKATGTRKYWRLQNMVHCAGLTDYVDIYF